MVTAARAMDAKKSLDPFGNIHQLKVNVTRAMLRPIGFQLRGRVLRQRTLARLGERSLIWADLQRTGATSPGMRVDVEGYEIDVPLGCVRALSEHRLKLIQLEWNATLLSAVGMDRRPVADLLVEHGYSLYRAKPDGSLAYLADLGFGPDVFARPAAAC